MDRLDIYVFGKQLLETNDLDPTYVVLHEAKLDKLTLHHFLLAYWCFYHFGTASWIVDQPSYWTAMRTAAASKDWPRSSERRHFRGEQARKSVEWLTSQGVERLFQFTWRADLTVARVMSIVQEWVGFGPWIAFKVADMIERLGICPVTFDNAAMFLFDSPREGAELLLKHEGNEGDRPASIGDWAVDRVLNRLGETKAPPRHERTVNAQEAETILCKWKSYMNGHYHVGEDIAAVKAGLMKFNRCPTAQRLLTAGKKGRLW